MQIILDYQAKNFSIIQTCKIVSGQPESEKMLFSEPFRLAGFCDITDPEKSGIIHTPVCFLNLTSDHAAFTVPQKL